MITAYAITFLKGALLMDADPYSKTMNNFTGSGRKSMHWPGA